MENSNSKWFASGLIIFLMMSLFSMTQMIQINRSGRSFDEFLVVAMPRPLKDLILGLSLEGRQIIREIEDEVLAATGNRAPKIRLAKKNGTKVVVDKGGTPSKNSAKKDQSGPFARIDSSQDLRRQAFQKRVIEEAERYRRSLMAQAETRAQEQLQLNSFQSDQRKNKNQAAGAPPESESETLTSAQWISLVLAQPTEANLGRMIRAMQKGEMEISTYLDITEKLIRDNSRDRKRLGVWALTSIYRREAFVAAAHLAAVSELSLQTLLQDYLFQYNQSQRLLVFDQVLRSQDPVAAAAAAQAITRSISAIQKEQGPNTESPAPSLNTSGRTGGLRLAGNGGAQFQVSLKSYKTLIPTLRLVADRNLHNLSQWAQSLLSQLQTLSTTA